MDSITSKNMRTGTFFNFRLTGRITGKIVRSWLIFIFCISTVWAIPDWGPEKNFSFVQNFIFTQIGSLSSVSLILFSLFLFNPSNIVIRALVITIAGNAGAIIPSILTAPLIFGVTLINQQIFQGIAFGNVLGLFYYMIPLYWQWQTEMEKASPEKSLKPHHPNRKKIPIDLDFISLMKFLKKTQGKIQNVWQ